MSLVNTAEMLQKARKGGYCVGAFNIVDYLTLEAVVRAAEKKNAPVIVQTSPGTVRRYGPKTLVAMTRSLAESGPVPVSLHLDHGKDREMIHESILAGYSSVMIDASEFPFEENVRLTKDVVDEAHRYGIAVEGEIGIVSGVEEEVTATKAIYTTPEEAIEFQKRTGVDFLAAAIGTAHGFYKTEPRLDLNTLRAIHSQAGFPLVIHGGTGLSFDVVRELVASGGSKMNVSTQLKKTYIDSLYDYIGGHREEYNPPRLLDYAQQQLIEVIASYIAVLGGEGKA